MKRSVLGHDPWSAEISAKCCGGGENGAEREMPAIKKGPFLSE